MFINLLQLGKNSNLMQNSFVILAYNYLDLILPQKFFYDYFITVIKL